MENGHSQFHRRALAALHELPSEEQSQVRQVLAALNATPLAEWPTLGATRLPGDQSLYLVRVNESLRMIVQAMEGQRPVVLDVVQQETLESFTRAAARTGS